MLKKIYADKMGGSDLGWLKSKFHFSFSNYYNPSNINFGDLRVLNDDLIASGQGFDMHPHKDMEILTYVIDGELTHEDNMGNKCVIKRGEIQYMSAGTGVSHSEHNFGDEILRLIQIWIYPDREGYKPDYGDASFDWDLRINNWFKLAGNVNSNAPIKIYQDVSIDVTYLEEGQEIDYPVRADRQAYLVQLEGMSIINDVNLNARDALEIIEEDIKIKAVTDSHLFIIEMVKR
ncbi:pirin family protein [Mollicutes bacterium LVI A0078]|nr:pirin family protein [Mollicutes bacterium LVI A0075]WOO91557.1 pirin family protein [Mollicutes bacterium LVI A0078]